MNTFGPVFLLGANGHKMLDSRIRRQYAPRVRGASRCCRPLPRSPPGAFPAPPALYRGALLLALNPFRDIPIVTFRLQGSVCRTIPLAGAQQLRNIGRLLQGPVQPEAIISRVPVQRADTVYRIADPVDRRFAGRHEVVPPCGLNTPSLCRSQTYTRHKATSSTP